MHRIFLVPFHHGDHAAASAILGFVLLALVVCVVCSLVGSSPHESEYAKTKQAGAA
jgi:hypothetical protein